MQRPGYRAEADVGQMRSRPSAGMQRFRSHVVGKCARGGGWDQAGGEYSRDRGCTAVAKYEALPECGHTPVLNQSLAACKRSSKWSPAAAAAAAVGLRSGLLARESRMREGEESGMNRSGQGWRCGGKRKGVVLHARSVPPVPRVSTGRAGVLGESSAGERKQPQTAGSRLRAGKHPGCDMDRRRRRAECRVTRAASRMRHVARNAIWQKREQDAPLQRILSVAAMRDMPVKRIL
ncbi:hypothetical protein L1887_62024 [Cichorium endivia]|nr:hypothetical protein L1887_62024 [Cichorium endivia]